MSRTDVHRPLWVQYQDPDLAPHMVPDHYHFVVERPPCTHEPLCTPKRWETAPRHEVRRVVPCDMDVYLNANGWADTRCRMVYRGGRHLSACRHHCCLCRGDIPYRHRRARAAWRADARVWLKGGEPRPPRNLT